MLYKSGDPLNKIYFLKEKKTIYTLRKAIKENTSALTKG